jgi:hypothetical protein
MRNCAVAPGESSKNDHRCGGHVSRAYKIKQRVVETYSLSCRLEEGRFITITESATTMSDTIGSGAILFQDLASFKD